MNQFLQDFIQHPEEAESRGNTYIIIISSSTIIISTICPRLLPTCP